ncbi:MAG: anion transporter [Proteobacteria bacterium]|nr:anion transporter [Pseudomonadota bacterium]
MDRTLLIFLLSYIVIALGQPPLFRIDRAGAAIIGAGLMILAGSISEIDAFMAVDYKTIIILFGMMIVVANLRLSGFFNIVEGFILKKVDNPKLFLKWLIIISAFLSAFFVNDTVCLMFTPFILTICENLKLNPKPFLIALCMSSNIGSVATLTGNPQNIIIGSAGQLSYAKFFIKMLPVSLIGIVILYYALLIFYKNELKIKLGTVPSLKIRYNRALTIKTLTVTSVVVIFFMLGFPMELVSLGAGCFLLITRRVKPEKVYALVDFRLLVFFIGLFIIIKSLDYSFTAKNIIESISKLAVSNLWGLSIISGLLSNIVSNVPAVLIFKPMLSSAQEIHWLILAMSSTLAGNLTILGSIANIIVIEGAKGKVKIGFFEYSKVGVFVTILSVFFGTIIVILQNNFF